MPEPDPQSAERPPGLLRRFRESLLGKALVVYLGVAVMMMFLENRFVFHPHGSNSWVPAPTEEIQDLTLQTSDGIPLHAWWLPEPRSERTLLYLHGNAGNLSHRGVTIVKLRRLLKASVLIVDYPGYGRSSGRPSESGCYQAADAAYDWLTETEKKDPRELILFGASLGGGVAVDVASRREHRALVLVKTFTALPDVGARQVPWLPVRWMMRNRFDSISKISKCRRPIFCAHGDADTLIPIDMGRRLFEAAGEPKAFLEMPGMRHDDPLPLDFFAELKGFLDKNP